MKKCSKCGNLHDGNYSWCKNCKKNYDKRLREKRKINYTINPPTIQFKVCNNIHCIHNGKLQSINNFPSNSTSIDGYHGQCKDCKKISDNKSWHINHTKRLNYKQNYYIQNKETILQKCKEYYSQNQKTRLNYVNHRYNLIKNNEDFLNKQKIYRQKNKHRILEWFALRRARKNKAVLKSINRKHTLSIYRICRHISKVTGILFSVDHIIPLKNKSISGFHYEGNLLILPLYLNSKKGNRFDFDLYNSLNLEEYYRIILKNENLILQSIIIDNLTIHIIS